MQGSVKPLGPVGIWSRQLRYGDPGQTAEAAAELEELGYNVLWIPDVGGPVLESVERLLAATSRVVVATGILNVWMHDPADVAVGHARLDGEYPERFLLGLGVGHAPDVDVEEVGRYRRPLAKMRAYLDALDENAPAGSRPARVLGALGPKMVALAGERTLGVHPYLVPVEHTAIVREALGPDRLIAPEQSAVVGGDAERARQVARRDLERYFRLPNYTNSFKRLGFSEADLAGGGSDRLVDAVYAWGSPEQIAARVSEHHEAGADHVCVRVVSDDPERIPLAEWRQLADVLISR